MFAIIIKNIIIENCPNSLGPTILDSITLVNSMTSIYPICPIKDHTTPEKIVLAMFL